MELHIKLKKKEKLQILYVFYSCSIYSQLFSTSTVFPLLGISSTYFWNCVVAFYFLQPQQNYRLLYIKYNKYTYTDYLLGHVNNNGE